MMNAPNTTLIFTVWFLLVSPMAGQMARARPARDEGTKRLTSFRESWRVLEPITRGNLSIYPVVSAMKVDTSRFLTLDEGLAKGEVRIAERGELGNALSRRRAGRDWNPIVEEARRSEGASVNELMLVNMSNRPLLLLAGEVVSGGKQNRIIGADVIVPPKSDPLPLSVFCVEHGRWSSNPGGFGGAGLIAHPEIRKEAQVSKSQSGVWDSVARSAEVLAAPSPTSSYLDSVTSPKARRSLDEVAESIDRQYERELRARVGDSGAVGVVVGINGELVWSDIFPSADLFRQYWPKLLRSYVLEADGHSKKIQDPPSTKAAQAFLSEDAGKVTINEEPGVFRRTEISAGDYQIVALEALNKPSGDGLLMHFNKMSRD
jgi:ARG and Rhodanese-Phosphatase-superfamily-associated Protein domain